MERRITGYWLQGFYDNHLFVHAPGAGDYDVLDPNGEIGPFPLRVVAPDGWGPISACVYSTDKSERIQREVIVTEEDIRGDGDRAAGRPDRDGGPARRPVDVWSTGNDAAGLRPRLPGSRG